MREKLIELLRGFFESVYPEFVYESLVDHLIANGVTVQQWIPVTERLPFAEYGESDDVLTITELGAIRTLYFNGGNWCFQNGDCCLYKITHWMPLPEPPKED